MTTGAALTRNLNQWLKNVGFVNGNPFASADAERERDYLPEYFVDTGHYPLILGDPQNPQSTLVLAPRGCGKTAYRVMLEQQCYPQDSELNALVIPYLSFDSLFEQTDLSLRQQLQCHLNTILRLSLRALEETRARFPEIDARITVAQHRTLQTLEQAYAPSLTPAKGRIPMEDFTTFVQFVRKLGIVSTYVIIDRLDEQPETADSPQAVVDLVLPLLAHLPLMELEGAAFKLFLPLETETLLRNAAKVRLDRLEVYTVEWTETLLQQLLEKRLTTFSAGRIKSLAQLARSPLSETIDRELVQWSNGSPRRLLRLGELLLIEHARQMQGEELLLTQETWERAYALFHRDFPPPELSINPALPQAQIGARLIGLTPLEHKFLLALYESHGWCEKEALIIKVWDTAEGVTDQAVSRLVRRIREKIEPLPGSPLYLLTEHNQGFRLEHLREA